VERATGIIINIIRASWLQSVQKKCADARITRSLVVIKVDRSTSQYCTSAFSAVSCIFLKTFFWEKANGCRVILLLLILHNILVSVTKLFAKDPKLRGTSHGHHQQFWDFEDLLLMIAKRQTYSHRDRDVIQTCYSIVFLTTSVLEAI